MLGRASFIVMIIGVATAQGIGFRETCERLYSHVRWLRSPIRPFFEMTEAAGNPTTRRTLRDLAERHDLRPFKPRSDDSIVEGMRQLKIGQTNSTADIKVANAVGGQTFAQLEAAMRPAAAGGSHSGFLGKGESLRQVLEADNRLVVDELKLTHLQLAEPLFLVEQAGDIVTSKEYVDRYLDLAWRSGTDPSVDFVWKGCRYRVKPESYLGPQSSPFANGAGSSRDYTVTNLRNGKRISFSSMMPDLIGNYGFYEGKGTEFRVDPRDIVEVFELAKPGATTVAEGEMPYLAEILVRLNQSAGQPYSQHVLVNVKNRIGRLNQSELSGLVASTHGLMTPRDEGVRLTQTRVAIAEAMAERAVNLKDSKIRSALREQLDEAEAILEKSTRVNRKEVEKSFKRIRSLLER